MNKIIPSILVFFALVFLQTGASFAASLDFKIGTKYRNNIQVGKNGIKVPLPAGEWILVGSHVEQISSNKGKKLNLHYVSMLNVKGKTIKGAIRFLAPEKRVNPGFPRSKFCERKDIHHIVNNGNYRKSRDCWGVKHSGFNPWDKMPEYVSETYDWIKNNDIKMPGFMMSSIFDIIANNRFLEINYYFNPQTEGFSRPSRPTSWKNSKWHRLLIHKYPKRQSYVKRRIAWSKDWHKKVLSAVNN